MHDYLERTPFPIITFDNPSMSQPSFNHHVATKTQLAIVMSKSWPIADGDAAVTLVTQWDDVVWEC